MPDALPMRANDCSAQYEIVLAAEYSSTFRKVLQRLPHNATEENGEGNLKALYAVSYMNIYI